MHTPVECSPKNAFGTSPIQELIIVHHIGHERVRHEAASQGNAIQEHQHDDGHRVPLCMQAVKGLISSEPSGHQRELRLQLEATSFQKLIDALAALVPMVNVLCREMPLMLLMQADPFR